MANHSQTVVTVAMAAFSSGWLSGLYFARRLPRDQDPDFRRSFTHENVNSPSGSPPLRLDPGSVQRGNGVGGPTTPKPDIVPKGQATRTARRFLNNPAQIAECGGPCTAGPSHCDCGELWLPVNPPPRNP